jgi:hypothetical protein
MSARFDLDMAAVATRLRADLNMLFTDSVEMARESIVDGSPVTGAPGQPVEDDVLRQSWKKEFLSPTHATVLTDSPYAESNEDGIARPGGGPYRLLSPVGGRFSIAKTVAGWGRIVDAAIAKQGQAMAGGGGD